jgi:integrase
MRGHVRRRGRNSFELKYDVDSDGVRRTVYRSYKGSSKREAQAELHRLLTQVADGSHTDPSKITVGEWLRDRLAQWRATGVTSPKTAERYADLIAAQIEPFLGTKPLQRLNTRDIEAWHRTLQTEGRKDRSGGISSRTVAHAHRVVAKALRDAVRHELVRRNVATEQRPPKVIAKEMQILTADQVNGLVARLDGHPLAAPALTALFTGMRRGELLALDWEHTDVDRKIINVVASLETTRAGGVRRNQGWGARDYAARRRRRGPTGPTPDAARAPTAARPGQAQGHGSGVPGLGRLDLGSERIQRGLEQGGGGARIRRLVSSVAPHPRQPTDRCRRGYCHDREAARTQLAQRDPAGLCPPLPQRRRQGCGCDRRRARELVTHDRPRIAFRHKAARMPFSNGRNEPQGANK